LNIFIIEDEYNLKVVYYLFSFRSAKVKFR
jgi:hypothetical protein